MAVESTPAVDREAELQRLVARLDDGFGKIVDAAAKGQDTTRWEDVWLKLLSEYEALHDELNGSTR